MAVLMRGGLYDEFVPSKLLPREFAVVLNDDPSTRDGKAIYICFGPGKVKRISTFEDMRDDMEEAAEEILGQYNDTFNQILKDTEELKKETEQYKEAIESIQNDIVNVYMPQVQEAAQHAADAKKSADKASDSAKLSESYARGGTGVRPLEDIDNSKFYAENAADLVEEAKRVVSAATSGALIPSGTILFENLPTEPMIGYMYNISNAFTADERFEIPGVHYGEGNNVYWTADKKWDVLVGIQQANDFVGTYEKMQEKLAKGELPDGTTAYTDGDYSGYVPGDPGGESIKIDIDSELSETSENPVQNKVVTSAINYLSDIIGQLPTETVILDDTLSKTSENGIKNKAVASAIESLQNSIPESITVDSELSDSSENPVQNKVISLEINILNLFRDFILNPLNKNGNARGNNIGNAVTDIQRKAIKNGSFDDLWLGDYWEINGINWRIWDFNYWMNTGSIKCAENHLVIIPDTILYNGAMYNTDVTGGGYNLSVMKQSGLRAAMTTISAAFPSMILSHFDLFTNSVENGIPTGTVWMNTSIDLPSEIMMCGSNIFNPANTGNITPRNNTVNKTQLSLSRLSAQYISASESYWLRDVLSVTDFVYIDNHGASSFAGASSLLGVRPVFGIHG